MRRWNKMAALVLAGQLSACASLPPSGHTISGLRLIGEQRIARMALYAGTVMGGFSGLDYDAARGVWLIESDDRCSHDPARYYEARLDYDAGAFHAVTMQGVHFYLNRDGLDFSATPAGCAQMDVESIRVDPLDGSIWYSSEGDRRVGISPFVRHIARDGAVLGELPLPPNFATHRDEERGTRYNTSLEGMAFAPDGASLWLSLEGPLYEDGPLPTFGHGAVVRMTRLQRDGKVLRQFAYPVDAVPVAPAPGKEAELGVTEILPLADGELLVLERASVPRAGGVHENYIRLYATDSRGASDVAALPALAGASYAPAAKRLVLDVNTLGLPHVDNLEGMAWGPRLPNGHASLVLVSDDNFSKTQVTQFLLFEVLP